MTIESREQKARRQLAMRRNARRAASRVDSMHLFNLLTSPELLDGLEALLPEYRERR